jgi:RimJ/RimL family protein N-acetyltransferase
MRSIWQGTRVRLRAVEPGDWESFFAWNDDDFTARRSSEIGYPQSREAVKEWTAKVATAMPENDQFRWIIENLEGQAVGTIITHNCNRRVGSLKYGLVIAAEHHRRGYAREAVQLVLRYFFEELNYQKVTVDVYDYNLASQRFHESLGFTLEGRVRRTIYTGGQHHDEFIYGLLREEFHSDLPPISESSDVPRQAP